MSNLLSRIPTWNEPADPDLFPESSPAAGGAFERVAAARGIEAPRPRRLHAVPEAPEAAAEPAKRDARRPVTFAEVVGQQRLVMRLEAHLRAAQARGEQPGHVLLTGGAGLGKTTLAQATAAQLGTTLHEVTGDAIGNPRKLAMELAKLSAGDVMFIDEVQGLRAPVQTALLRVLEDGVMFCEGSAKQPAIRFDVPAFTMLAASTHPGRLSAPLRGRFRLVAALEEYEVDDLGLMGMQYAERAGINLDTDAALLLAGASRGTPRRLVRLVDAANDYSIEVTGKVGELIDEETARQALEFNDLDALGLERRDHRYLETLVHTFNGGPVGAPALAGVLGWDPSELVQDVEPYLTSIGVLTRRSTGRCATEKTYRVLGLPVPPIINGYR
jgi:Holliday junction DNA helicase RuvB